MKRVFLLRKNWALWGWCNGGRRRFSGNYKSRMFIKAKAPAFIASSLLPLSGCHSARSLYFAQANTNEVAESITVILNAFMPHFFLRSQLRFWASNLECMASKVKRMSCKLKRRSKKTPQSLIVLSSVSSPPEQIPCSFFYLNLILNPSVFYSPAVEIICCADWLFCAACWDCGTRDLEIKSIL